MRSIREVTKHVTAFGHGVFQEVVVDPVTGLAVFRDVAIQIPAE